MSRLGCSKRRNQTTNRKQRNDRAHSRPNVHTHSFGSLDYPNLHSTYIGVIVTF
jgi:hypothetical protein